MGALRDLGLQVGRDVAVVGFNDITIAADLPTPLSTVRSPLKQMGGKAAGLLLQRLKQGHGLAVSTKEIRLHPQLIVRESSDMSVDSRSLRRENAQRRVDLGDYGWSPER